MKSRMYGRAGWMAAAIGAVLILDWRNYGLLREFLFLRIVETFISVQLGCGRHPIRASQSFFHGESGLRNCIKALNKTIVSLTGSEPRRLASLMNFRGCVNEFGEYVDEALVEPSFWFLPFDGGCYRKLQGKLSKLVNLMHFQIRALEVLDGGLDRLQASSKDMLDKLCGDAELFGDLVKTSTKGIGEMSTTESIVVPADEVEVRGNVADSNPHIVHVRLDADEILGQFVKELKGTAPTRSVVMSLSSIGYLLHEELHYGNL